MQPKAATTRGRTWFFWVLAVGILVGVLPLLASPRDVWAAIASLEPAAFGLALVLVSCGFCARAWRWHRLLKAGAPTIKARRTIASYVLGLGLGASPAKVAELVKLAYLRRHAGIPLTQSAGAFVVDRAGDAIGVIILIMMGAADWTLRLLLAGLALAALATLGVAAATIRRTPDRERPEPMGRFARLRRAIWQAAANASSVLTPTRLVGVSILGAAAWTAEALAMTVLASSLGADAGFAVCAFAYGLGSIAGFVSMLPGGLGAAEITTSALLITAGIPGPEAVALTLGVRAATFWYGLVVGGLGFLALSLRGPVASEPTPTEATSPASQDV